MTVFVGVVTFVVSGFVVIGVGVGELVFVGVFVVFGVGVGVLVGWGALIVYVPPVVEVSALFTLLPVNDIDAVPLAFVLNLTENTYLTPPSVWFCVALKSIELVFCVTSRLVL